MHPARIVSTRSIGPLSRRANEHRTVAYNGKVHIMRKPLLGGSLVVSLLAAPTQAPFAPIAAAAQIEADVPTYEGRTLESWLKDLSCTPCGPEHGPAANAIRQMGTRATPYLLHAIEAGNADASLSVAAIRELGPVAGTAIPALTELLKKERSSAHAALALVYLSSERPVIEALSSTSPSIREGAVVALGYGGSRVDASAVPILIKMLEEAGPPTRFEVVWALGQIHKEEERTVSVLVGLLKDEDPWMRVTSAQTLGAFRLDKAPIPRLNALTDHDARVRAAASRSLGLAINKQTDDDSVQTVVAALLVALKDNDENVRLQSAWSLGAIGPRARDAISALVELTGDSSQDVRQTAAASLAHIRERTRD
jgi:HEAT repeat protein